MGMEKATVDAHESRPADERPAGLAHDGRRADRNQALMGSRLDPQRLFEGPGWRNLRVASDVVALVAAPLAALAAAPDSVGPDGRTLLWLLGPMTIALLALWGLYASRTQPRMLDAVGKIIAATSLATIVLIAGAAFIEPRQPAGTAAGPRVALRDAVRDRHPPAAHLDPGPQPRRRARLHPHPDHRGRGGQLARRDAPEHPAPAGAPAGRLPGRQPAARRDGARAHRGRAGHTGRPRAGRGRDGRPARRVRIPVGPRP